MDDRDRNRITLFRNYERTDKQPVAKGKGLVGEGDFRIVGSMWPSKKGTGKDGKPWQLWTVSIQPANDETRVLVAVPREALDRVKAVLAEGTPDVPPLPGGDGEAADDDPESLPF